MTAQQALKSLTGDWNLTSLNGRDVSALAGLGGKRPSISIEPDGRVGGFAGVNRVGGQLDVASLAVGGFKTGPMFSTKMAGPPEAMRLEDEYVSALNNVRSFSIKDGMLSLIGEGTRLDFAR
ncbi:MAG: META domain-containing protein [Phycisphaerales bacterium]